MNLSPIDVRYFKEAVNASEYKESSVDIACKCPICGDSKQRNKMRLHLYIKNNITFVHCFNEGCGVNTNMYGFLKNYYPILLFDYRREMFQNNLSLVEKEQKDDSFTVDTDLSWFNDSKCSNDTQNSHVSQCSHENHFKTFNLPLEELSSNFLTYLESRGVKYRPEIFGRFYNGNIGLSIEGKFYSLQDKIVIPLYKNENIYGFYSRSIIDKRFITCNLNQDYKIWNWFNIDKEKPVYIFEGIFDALSFYEMYQNSNVIALCGADIPNERLEELHEPYFCLDNDKTGINTMLKYTKDIKNKFLLWDTCYKDFNEALLAGQKIPLNFLSGFKATIKLKEKL